MFSRFGKLIHVIKREKRERMQVGGVGEKDTEREDCIGCKCNNYMIIDYVIAQKVWESHQERERVSLCMYVGGAD